jgi:alpha-D-ribose 1-methylphosphonate 5-triphosphate synthase subunit PhnI
MAYVAARGDETAIQNAESLFHELNDSTALDAGMLVRNLQAHLPYLVDRVMAEGSLYAPEVAALALTQAGGDLYEAVLLVRAYRSTLPRLGHAATVEPDDPVIVRRISAAFKDIPGGQLLGPTLDYSHRILNFAALDEAQRDGSDATHNPNEASAAPHTKLPAVAEWQRLTGLLEPNTAEQTPPVAMPDITRAPLAYPALRGGRLQALSRADTGGVLALGYASMRGYGMIHPTINELRLCVAEVNVQHPHSGEAFSAGRVRLSQAEVVNTFADGGVKLDLGFCATVGWNEVKTIAGAMLDSEMSKATPAPMHTEEFVLEHTEPVESSGFCIHYKLPHYVTFSSSLDAMRRAAKVGATHTADVDTTGESWQAALGTLTPSKNGSAGADVPTSFHP